MHALSMTLSQAGRRLLVLWVGGVVGLAAAQGLPVARPADARPARPVERSVTEWLVRMHEASRQRNYIGTFVVSSNAGSLATARIWHACDGRQQVERVESLTGARRTTFRRNDEVVTFHPETKTARSERRESLGIFPELMKSSESAIPEFYGAQSLGTERVAGFDADVVHLVPKDNLRFGYRIWSEKKSGLVVKSQTLDADGAVLEQAAFSELQLDAPVRMDKLAQGMVVPEGWRHERSETTKTTAAAEGWGLRSTVPGFRQISCYKRPAEGVLQWIFSDGLASVSLFVEAYDRQRHTQEGLFSAGATHTLAQKHQDWWVTAVGEVPAATLRAFAQNLERRR